MRAPFRSVLLLLPLAAFAVARPQGLGFDPKSSNGLERAASIYIAPENEFLYRMRSPDGSYREFQKDDINSSAPVKMLWSPNDWKGAVREKEGLIYVESNANVPGGHAVYLFRNGSLVQFEQKGVKLRVPPDARRLPTAGGPPWYFDGEAEAGDAKAAGKKAAGGVSKEVQRELKKKWAKSGRLRWPFENPNDNGFLYLSLALFSTALFFCAKLWVKVAGGVLFAAASAALVMTASRGSFLAFAFGLTPLVALNFRKLVRSKLVWLLAGIVLVTAGAWFATHESRLLTRGFTKESKWSNETRIEMWKTAPQMIAEAPKGWDGLRVNPRYMAGRAYTDWYDSLSTISLSGSLVNDHLTRLVGYSQTGRFAYLFVWFGLLALMAYTATRTKRAVALGVLMALAVAGWFNAVLMNTWLRAVPLAALALFVAGRPWRVWRRRPVLAIMAGSAALAAVTLTGIVMYGRATVKRGCPIYVGDGQVRVKGQSPDIWIVDDGKALGGALSCRDIRRYFLRHPSAPAVGYVRSVEDLPEKARRLVLAGGASEDWLRRLKGVDKGGPVIMPEELVVISPTVDFLSQLDTSLLTCKTQLVVGELYARYYEELAEPPAWITIVPGMELYIDNWMRFAVE